MHNPFEYLDEITGLLGNNYPFIDDSRFKEHFIAYGEKDNPFDEIYLGDIQLCSEIEIESIKEINEYFDQKEAENNISYGAILNRMHKINVKFDKLNLTKEKEALIKFYYENQNQFSTSGYSIIKNIEAAENSVKQINARFNLLKIDINNLKNAVEEAFIEIEITNDKAKVLLLEHLGVLDFIRTKYIGITNHRLGEIFGPIIDKKPKSFAKILDRLHKVVLPGKDKKKSEQTFNELKLVVRKK
jgi:hypothetical protein